MRLGAKDGLAIELELGIFGQAIDQDKIGLLSPGMNFDAYPAIFFFGSGYCSRRIRKRLGISNPGEVVFQAPQGRWSDNDIVVEADGIGGATLLVVEGNYPIDYSIKFQRKFPSEDAASEAAEKLEEEQS